MAQSRSALVEALSHAVLALAGGDETVGTGFFVAPGLVLTCAHVVPEGLGTVSAVWAGETLALAVVPEWRLPSGPDGTGPDLALLRLERTIDHPVVCLAFDIEPGDELWGYGHPDGVYRAGDSVTFRATGPSSRGMPGEEAVPLQHVSDGRAGPGFSGGPVLNWRTGAVCGVMRFAYGLDRGVPGARLVPIARILAAYPFLEPPQAVTADRRAWLRRLDDDQLRHGGWRYPGPMLRDYLESARDAALNHPYAIGVPGAARPLLSEVYLDQRMVPYAAVNVPDASITRIPALAVLDMADKVMVISGPGTGKSSLLRRLTATLADQWLLGESPPPVVPVRIPARSLLLRGGLGEALRTSVQEDLGTRLWQGIPEGFFAAPPMAETAWLVIVDGIDEVIDPDDRKSVVETLARLWRSPDRGYRVVAATRPLPSDELKPLFELDAAAYRLEPFTLGDLEILSSGWFARLGLRDADALAERFVDAVHGSDIGELGGVPLIATMLVLLFAERPEAGLPHSRTELYEQFVDLLLVKMHRRPTSALTQLQTRVEGWGSEARHAVDLLIQRTRSVLESVALTFREGGHQSPLDLAVNVTAETKPPNFPLGEWRVAVREVLVQSGLMTATDTDLMFLHQTILEFLAACAFTRTRGADIALGLTPIVGYIDEQRELVEAPNDNSFARFVFSLWARDGQDIGPLVLALYERDPDSIYANRDDRGDRPLPPGEGTGLSAVLLRERNVIPEPARSVVIGKLVRAALEYGRIWAATAIAYADRVRGCELLARMASMSSLALYVRLDAARELARWDPVGGSEILAEFAREGPELGGYSEWRSIEGPDTFFFPVPVDIRTALSTKLDAALYLAEVDSARAIGILDAMALDPARPLLDRVRIAWTLRELDPVLAETRFHEITALPSIDDPISVETFVGFARTQGETESRMDLLIAWAMDPTRDSRQRLMAAIGLATIDGGAGVDVFRALVGPVGQPVSYSITTTADGVHSMRWSADPDVLESWTGMPLHTGEDLVIAAECLAELDTAAAVTTMFDRLVAMKIELLPERFVALLATLDRAAACEALSQRVSDGFGHEVVAEAGQLAELDPAIARDVLIEATNRASLPKVELIRILAALDRQAALDVAATIIEQNFFDTTVEDMVELLEDLDPELIDPALVRRADYHQFSAFNQVDTVRRLIARGSPHAIPLLHRIVANGIFPHIVAEARSLLAGSTGTQQPALPPVAAPLLLDAADPPKAPWWRRIRRRKGESA
ncbi:trypsin-like peptidase domain-containing protein [Nocardia niwae]|uniref:Trypsin-like peptidase domain-containing protein n=1 Tax=Nocardia niwae TaxID=626084 RepID=A0ABV2X5F9_9NOCA